MHDPLDRRQLREVAEAATEGEWWCHNGGSDTSHSVRLERGNLRIAAVGGISDARFIATFDPPTALSLLDALDEAEAALAALPAPVPEGVPEAELVEWILGADHHPGCSGTFPEYRCKCGLRDLLARLSDTPHEEGEQP